MIVFIYILFLYSGLLKSVFLFYNIELPIDITLITACLLVISFFIDVWKNNFKVKLNKTTLFVISSILLFFFWILFTLIYSPSEKYSFIKSFYFTTNILTLFFPLLISNFNVKKFIKFSLFSSLSIAIWYFWVDFNSSSYIYKSIQYQIYSSLYLTISGVLGVNFLILLTTKSILFNKKIYDTILIIITLSFMLLIRGRGPLLFAIIIAFIYFSYKLLSAKKINLKINLNRVIFALFLIVGFSIIITILLLQFNEQILAMLNKTFYRFAVIFSGLGTSDMGNSVNTRVDHIYFSKELILDNFTNFIGGYGIGSYGILYLGIDQRTYPHNIILEIMVELGIIGLILFSIYLFFNLFYRKQKNQYISSFVIFYLILNMLKSSSLVDLRMYFAIFAMFLIINTKAN